MNKQKLIDDIKNLTLRKPGLSRKSAFHEAIEESIDLIHKHTDGMVIVPIDPTKEMIGAILEERILSIDAGDCRDSILVNIKRDYKAMLKACEDES